MEHRRLLIAAALSLAVLIGWQILFPPPPPEPPGLEPLEVSEAPPAASGSEPGEGAFRAESERQAVEPDVSAAPRTAAAGMGSGAVEVADTIEASREELLVVETPDIRVELSNRGGQIVSYVLKNHGSEATEQVDLLRARAKGPYLFAFTDGTGLPSPLNDALFTAEEASSIDGGQTIVFRYRGPAGEAEKRYTFDPDGQFSIRADVEGGDPWGLSLGPGVRNPTEQEMGDRFRRRAAVYRIGDEVEVVDSEGADVTQTVPGDGLMWAGVEDTYFLTALIPRRPIDSLLLAPVLVSGVVETGFTFEPLPPKDQLSDAQEDLHREILVVARTYGETIEADTYFGAKEFEQLASYGLGLEDTVEWGWVGFLVRPLQLGLAWIYDNVVSNWGWAIVLMTVAIKILLLPLTHKGLMSMQKMQALSPKINAIKEKYKAKGKDKKGRPNPEAQRKMNEEIMGLYKKEGVNPVGGCLPMLLQLPILFAFYRMLYTSVELRGAPWMFVDHGPDGLRSLPSCSRS